MVRLLSLIAFGSVILSAQDARDIIRRSIQLDQRNNEAARNYTFLQRQLERQFDGAGKVKDEKLRTWDVTMQEGSPYRRLVARNDQPISAEEVQNEQAKLQQSIE